jgi:AraC-like DNA-binding protein
VITSRAETLRLTAALRETGAVLARAALVQDYCTAFARLSRIGLSVTPAGVDADEAAWNASAGSVALMARVPVRMGRFTVAWLSLEPVRWSEPTSPAAFGSEVLWRRSAAGSAARLRRIDGAQYAAWLRLVTIFARQLGERGNELAVKEAEGRHPLVRRVKEFIVLHAGEEIMLRRAAAVAGFSPCYFCKLFHRVAGMGFSEYLARLRVEAAKALLMDPHTRINEAAFRAGFQSLSQFNRAFRRITGEAPTDLRGRLAAGLGSRGPTALVERWRVAA